MRGCGADMVLNLCQHSGLVCTKILRMSCPYGWLVLGTLRSLDSSRYNFVWTLWAPSLNLLNTRHKKEVVFLGPVIHKAMTVNERQGQILVEVDKSCPHCGAQFVGVGRTYIL